MDLNQTTTESEIYPAPEFQWTSISVLKSVIFLSIIFCTIMGNGLVLLSIYFDHTLRSPTHIFIGNLALADFLVGLLVLPCNATTQITSKWFFGQIYCVAWHCIHLWLCSTSILSILSVCFDRYVGVSRPLKHFKLMRGKIIKILIGAVWISAFCLGVIPVFLWPEKQDTKNQYECKINQQFGLVMVVTVGIFYIPMSLMILFYWRIYCTAKNYLHSLRLGQNDDGLRIHKGGGSMDTITTCSSNSSSTGSTSSLLAINFTRQTKAAKRLTFVIGTFIFCYFPFFTVFLIGSLNPGLISDDLFSIFGWLRYFNSCLNPFIYAATMPAFRKSFGKILCCFVRREK